MEYTLLYMYEHHKKYKKLCVGGGGEGEAQKLLLQHISIIYYNYNFVQTVILFQTKSS